MVTTGTPSVDTVMAVFTAVEQRDDDALARVCQPDVEFCWPPPLPYGGRVLGRAAAHRRSPAAPAAGYCGGRPGGRRAVAAARPDAGWGEPRQRGSRPYRVREGKLARAQMFH